MNLDDLRAAIERALERSIPAAAPPLLAEVMRYPLVAGGKRLRPCLTLAAAEAIALREGVVSDAARAAALPFAVAIELVHTYSLVHDDLPAMDNDTLRRGRPTTHVIYGDGMAILAGDGLLTEAFAVISESPSRFVDATGAIPVSAAARARGAHILAMAAGAIGMVGGQAIDLTAAAQVPHAPPLPLDASSLEAMHARKTGALIRASVTLGAVAAGADDATFFQLDEYARHLGLAFQIVDDVLDVEGSGAELGKTPGKDAAAGKVTYPSLYGLERSRAMAAECISRAKDALAAARVSGRLVDIADWTLTRRS